jgi:hypothetical protein
MFYNWKIALSDKHFRNRFLISLSIVCIILTGFAALLAYIETVQGHVLYDPVLNFIKPHDVSLFIFLATYFTAIVAVCYALGSPYKGLHLLQMYGILTFLRIITLFFLPLESPLAIIPLNQEYLPASVYSEHHHIKNLLFSGHASTLFLFFFFSLNKWLKGIFLVTAVSVSLAVVVQHVNYSYDVIVAPLFAYIAYRIVVKFSKHYYKEITL